MATLVKVSRKRDKKIRAVRGTVALLDYDDLKRKDEILGRYIIITLGPNPNFNAPKTQHEWIKISIEDRSIFLLLFLFFSNEDNPILIYYYLVITKSKCCITKVLSITIFVFFFTIYIDTSIDSFHKTKRLFLSDQVSIIKGQNGYFMRHDLISSYSSYSISIVRRNSVLKQSSKTNCIFRVKLVLDRASIADIPITDLLINRIESLALHSIKWFPTKTR